jgi:hypothetical protein
MHLYVFHMHFICNLPAPSLATDAASLLKELTTQARGCLADLRSGLAAAVARVGGVAVAARVLGGGSGVGGSGTSVFGWLWRAVWWSNGENRSSIERDMAFWIFLWRTLKKCGSDSGGGLVAVDDRVAVAGWQWSGVCLFCCGEHFGGRMVKIGAVLMEI